MTVVRYSVPGVPAGPGMGISAFMPAYQPYCASGAQQYKYGITGGPAKPHPIDMRDTPPSPDVGDLAMAGTARSSDCPNGYWPNDYDFVEPWRERPGAGMPILLADNGDTAGMRSLLPIPAGNPAPALRQDSAILARPALLNRVRQLPWFPRIYKAPDS